MKGSRNSINNLPKEVKNVSKMAPEIHQNQQEMSQGPSKSPPSGKGIFFDEKLTHFETPFGIDFGQKLIQYSVEKSMSNNSCFLFQNDVKIVPESAPKHATFCTQNGDQKQ